MIFYVLLEMEKHKLMSLKSAQPPFGFMMEFEVTVVASSVDKPSGNKNFFAVFKLFSTFVSSFNSTSLPLLL